MGTSGRYQNLATIFPSQVEALPVLECGAIFTQIMNQKFEFTETGIPGLIEITPFNVDDVRGCFTKDYSKEVFEANGIHHDLAEVFYTTRCPPPTGYSRICFPAAPHR